MDRGHGRAGDVEGVVSVKLGPGAAGSHRWWSELEEGEEGGPSRSRSFDP